MPTLRIEPDPIRLALLEAGLAEVPDKIAVAERDALNKSVTHGVAVAATDLSKELGANRSSVRKRMTLFKATKAKLSAAIVFRGGAGINLYGFGARQTSSGVTVKVMGQRQSILHGFITKGLGATGGFSLGATGNKIVALRSGDKREMKNGRYAGRTVMRGPRVGQPLLRQPIVAQRGPTVAETWEKTPGVADHTTDEVNSSLRDNLESQLRRFE